MTGSKLPVKAVALDLDGTLVDSAPDIAHALNHALREARLLGGMDSFDVAAVRGWVGDGPDALIARAIAFMRARGDVTAHADPAALRRGFDAATLAAPLGLGTVYAGMEAALRELAAWCPLVVVTNKPTALARAVIAAANLSPYLTAVYGADRREDRKPGPALLARAAHDLGRAPGELLMVGDSIADMGAARAAGAHAAWVSWGYGHGEPPTDAYFIDAPDQLTAVVRRAMQARKSVNGQ
ncbi:HAD-IA family hydrolase [Caenimonas koreensis DSM 17982]|uniref:phosphoglycolate phosphatase n=1 Tax=Caenimonas koreensis DSM 17982 TaxID=1121255 RepID=A0A844BE77_9BURK|nr:HAD-IA family hydrolase [Caenimonas koreensis]MRD48771.1 HAD-IA family hydrolase [Caenimonas koreensis DSM 17982]